MLKKCISMLLLVALLFSFVGCGSADNESLGTTHTHSYTEQVTEPTCETAGVKTFTCSCGDYYTEDIPATGVHTWANATCEKAKHCTGCYLEEGEPLGHSWKDATCEDPKTCSRCGETDGWSGTGHTWQNATCTDPNKCTVCGVTVGSAKGHRYGPSDVCYNCGANSPAAEAAYAKCSLTLPGLPASYSLIYSNGVTQETVKVTKITYEFTGYSASDGTVALRMYVSGSKTYDKGGSNISSTFLLPYKLYDANGSVVDSGSFYTPSISVGDSFSDVESNLLYNLKPSKYKLVLLDRQ